VRCFSLAFREAQAPGTEETMSLLLSWLAMSVAFWLTAQLLPGFEVKGFKGALWVAAIFGVI
jgi:uncharacterized membrane protein YvlD (DUF360 family)